MSDEKQQTQKPSFLDWLTRLVLPIVLVIVAQLQQQRARFWGLLSFAALSLAVGFGSSLKAQIRGWKSRRRDEQIAKRAFADLRRFLRQFGEFVDVPTAREDTLHRVCQNDLSGGRGDVSAKLGIAPSEPFKQHCHYLKSRVERQSLVDGALECNSLVGSYTVYCVLPVFERFPQELRPLLTEGARSSLEAFRQRFDRFLHDYSEYLKSVDESFSTPRIQSYYFSRPKPL
jgi:hypothetical protein